MEVTIYLLGDIMDKLRRIAMKLKESFLTGLIGPTNDTQLTIVVEKVNTDVVDVIFKTNVLVYLVLCSLLCVLDGGVF